jgi:hypothetical protein
VGRVAGDTSGSEERPATEWRYANCIRVGHNAFEFLLDFGQVSETGEPATSAVKIVTNPQFAKALRETLDEAIREYEQTFGLIRIKEDI